MPDSPTRALAEAARWAAERVSQDIAENYLRDIEISHKTSASDPVTEVDRRSETRIREHLLKAYPESSIIGEEFGEHAGVEGGVRWHIDPLDGTLNYVSGIPYFSTSIGVEVEGRLVAGAVHDPLQRETFWADEHGAWLNDSEIPHVSNREHGPGVLTIWPFFGTPPTAPGATELLMLLREIGPARARGSFALQLAHVAAGRAAAALELRAGQPWDSAGGLAIAQAVGCAVRILDPAPEGYGPWAGPAYVVASDVEVADRLAAAAIPLLR